MTRSREMDRLNVAIVGWARLSAQEREGSGYNLSASNLAAALAARGHRVAYLRSGMTYGIPGSMHVSLVEEWRGVSCFDLVNSPNLSPAGHNFRNMATEVSCPAQTRLVLDWLRKFEASIVHIHSLEGFSLDLIPAIRSIVAPVVVTPHNYWYVCPQVDLLYQEREICLDYGGGLRCSSCLDVPEPRQTRRRRAIWQTLETSVGRSAAHFVRGSLSALRARAQSRSQVVPEEVRAGPIVSGLQPDGTLDYGLRTSPDEMPPLLGESPMDQNERFLSATHHSLVSNEYGQRRAAGVRALNHASRVLPPSEFLLRAYATMGVEEKAMRLVRLGAPHFDLLKQRAQASPYYSMRPWRAAGSERPLRLGFFGTTRNNKGLRTLIDAIPLLSPDVRRRCQFLIRAGGADWPFRKVASRFPEVQFAGGYDLIQRVSGWGEYDVGVLTHVWFENSPFVLLEHLYGGKFTLSPRLGGVPEWIDPPRNGLLFEGGRADTLARCIEQLVDGTISIPSSKEILESTPLTTFDAHVSEIESLYKCEI